MFAKLWAAIAGLFKKSDKLPAPIPGKPIVGNEPVPAVVVPSPEVIENPPAPSPIPKAWAVPSFAVQGKGRDLEKELEKIIDARLMLINPNGLKAACEAKDGNELVALANEALESLKVREKTNNNDGPMVVLIQKTVGSAGNEPWCMAEQQTCIAYAERKTGKVSPVVADESTITVATTVKGLNAILTPAQQKKGLTMTQLKLCKRGDIWIWQHGTAWKGHTGNFMKWSKPYTAAILVEGNTTAGTIGGAIVREGGGTYRTERSSGRIGDMTLIAVVRAF